jgi:hypothetical protein
MSGFYDVAPDPEYLRTDKWRERRNLSLDMEQQIIMRAREAWRDYLASGRVSGTQVAQLADHEAACTITWTRR